MFAKLSSVPWWCGVDVMEENGLVRRGMICGKAPNGVFVDFGYPGHNMDYVPSDLCYRYRALSKEDGYKIGDAVEVLYQSAPDQPWRWYPGKYLGGSQERFAFVAVTINERVMEKVLPEGAVRIIDGLDHSGSDILLHYFEHDFEIPKSGHLGRLASSLIDKFTEAEFLKLWSRETWTIGRKLEGGRLFYSRQFAFSIPSEAIGNIFTQMACKYVSSEAASGSSISMNNGAVYRDSMDIDQLDPMEDPTRDHPPLEIMHEIFSCLSPLQQVPCRRVCQLWNSMLTSVASTCRVEIDIRRFTTLRKHNETTGYHKLAVMLHERVTESTRVLILSGRHNVQKLPKIQYLHTVKMMLKAMKLRVRFIVLTGVEVDSHDLLDSWYSDECDDVYHSKWRDVCDILILHSVAVGIPFAKTTFVVVEKEILNVQVDVGVENVLEKWCPVVSGPEMEELERKIRLVWGHAHNENLWMSVLLNTYQCANEQFSPYGLDSVPLVDDFAVPAVASLRKLTVWALTGHSRITTVELDSRITAEPT